MLQVISYYSDDEDSRLVAEFVVPTSDREEAIDAVNEFQRSGLRVNIAKASPVYSGNASSDQAIWLTKEGAFVRCGMAE